MFGSFVVRGVLTQRAEVVANVSVLEYPGWTHLDSMVTQRTVIEFGAEG